MTPPAGLEDLLGRIADGLEVDWDSAASAATTDADRAIVAELRVLAGLADLHRSTTDPGLPPAIPGASNEVQGLSWGRYTLIEKIGEGSFGAVYRARDNDLERNVAIKLLHPSIAERDPLSERIRKEGVALARIRHQNVVTVFGVETHGGRLGLCMEHVPGRTLEDEVRETGVLGAAEAGGIGQAVCRALDAVHASGLVHRDVKARNVMRESSGRIVLMDFGTGREVSPLGRLEGRDVAGTPLYMAPEVVDGLSASVQSDVYAVGVLLYYLVTRRFPVEGATFEDIREGHRTAKRRFVTEHRPDLPLEFVKVVERAISPEPVDRYGSARDLCDALVAAVGLQDHGSDSRPAPLPWSKRLLLAAALVLAALALTTACGLLGTLALNVVLGRPMAFTGEGPGQWLGWGLKSLVVPMIQSVLLLILAGVPVGLWMLVGIIPAGAAFRRRAKVSTADWLVRHGLARPTLAALAVFGASVVGLAALAFAYRDLIAACIGFVSYSDFAQLAPLDPVYADRQTAFRRALTSLAFFSALGWLAVWAMSHFRRIALFPLIGGAVTLALTVFLLELPYQILVQNERDEVAFRGWRCYITGQTAEEYLLFCPASPVPRNHFVARQDPSVEKTGRVVSIFTDIASSPRSVP